MDAKHQVGQTAGQVWQLLNSEGPLTLVQLKKKLNAKNDLLNFAVGWLAREDKIDITPDKKDLRLQVK